MLIFLTLGGSFQAFIIDDDVSCEFFLGGDFLTRIKDSVEMVYCYTLMFQVLDQLFLPLIFIPFL